MKKIIVMALMSIFVLSACESESADSSEVKNTIEKKVIEDATDVEIASTSSAIEQAKPVVKEKIKAAEKVALSGEQIYKKSCIGCHGSGAAGAPKLGDKAAWAPRLSKGKNALYLSAIKGIPGTAMMAKGTCGACSDGELKSAVDYLVEKSK